MAYTYRDAIKTLYDYLNLSESEVEKIPDTNDRGIIISRSNEKLVIFIYPISCKKDNKQNFFDTRDSGATERKVAWKYAADNHYKYFCLGVNSEQDRYKDYVISLECSEERITKLSFREAEGVPGTGTQVNIPANYIPNKDFERICTPIGIYLAFIQKENINEYLHYFDYRPYCDSIPPDLTPGEGTSIPEQKLPVKHAENILLYGVPGAGKSYTIKTEYCDDNNLMERVVFHPDYSNSDFIGQILPSNINGNITYPFIPGPFTRILKKAYDQPETMFYLIIEEINRGNAPAIFGEVFQLLDRKNGESEYGISNQDIAKWVYGEEKKDELVKIPSNLTILATMNTADQNVFTLDTAFKRRWKMISIPNDFENCELSNIIIGGTNLTWEEFAKTINGIIENDLSGMSSEDKRLGAYFVTKDEIQDGSLFAEKVLAYLWNDVFKYDREKVFDPNLRTLDKLLECFADAPLKVFFGEALKDFEIKSKDNKEQQF